MAAQAARDVIVIGLGAFGSATAYQLARRGATVLGIDRHDPPHAFGSSHGTTRITRLAIGEGEAYVPFVRRSHAIWRELEETTGASLYQPTGGLVMGRPDAARSHLHKPDFVRRTIDAARRHRIAHELLDAAAIHARFPQFTVEDDVLGYYEPEAGVLRPEACIAAQLDQRAGSARVSSGASAWRRSRPRPAASRSAPIAAATLPHAPW